MVKLTKQAHNLHRLELDDITIWFSYETPIAFEATVWEVVENHPDATHDKVIKDAKEVFYITKNIWSNTTGKHLNMINPDRSIRIDNHEFIKLLTEALE